jgi:hypothetical protein
MRIGAHAGEGELRHVGLGDNDRAGRAQAAHNRRVGKGGFAFLGQNLGASTRYFAGNVEQIFN